MNTNKNKRLILILGAMITPILIYSISLVFAYKHIYVDKIPIVNMIASTSFLLLPLAMLYCKKH